MDLNRFKAAIFDFDGVLALTEPVHFSAYERPAKERGLDIPRDFFHSMIGRTDEDCAKELSEFWGGKVTPEDVLARKHSCYRQIGAEEAHLVPGILKFLDSLTEKKFKLGIGTSSFRADIEPFLAKYDWANRFHTIRTIETVSKPKPDPEMYESAMRDLGVTADETVIFEDSKPGITAALGSGAFVVGLLTTFVEKDLPPAHRFVPDYEALMTLCANAH